MQSSEIYKYVEAEFRASVKRWLMSDVEIACSLSGGLDSAVIVGVMAQELANLRTYTLGFSDSDTLDERALARYVSSKYKTKHHEITINSSDILKDIDAMIYSLDEPYGGGLPSWFIYKSMSNNVKVCMTGTGGDELFGNYGKWRVFENYFDCVRQSIGFLRRDTHWLKDYIKFPIGSRYPMYFRQHEKKRYLSIPTHAHDLYSSEVLIEKLWRESKSTSSRNKVRDIDMKIQLPDEFLHMTDRFSMAFSIEARPPFLDRDFAINMLKIPSSLRIGKNSLKKSMINSLKNYIPPELMNAKKKGFVLPVSSWLRKELRPQVEYFLGKNYLKKQGIFNDDIYQYLVIPHLEGKKDIGTRLWTLLMFQLWYEKNT